MRKLNDDELQNVAGGNVPISPASPDTSPQQEDKFCTVYKGVYSVAGNAYMYLDTDYINFLKEMPVTVDHLILEDGILKFIVCDRQRLDTFLKYTKTDLVYNP